MLKSESITKVDGQQVSIPWIEIIRLENGQLAEAWLETDTRLFSDQLLKEIRE